jgi:hypothetical protein
MHYCVMRAWCGTRCTASSHTIVSHACIAFVSLTLYAKIVPAVCNAIVYLRVFVVASGMITLETLEC